MQQRWTTFDLIFSSASLQTTDPAFRSAMQNAIVPIQGDKRVKSIATPYTTTGALSASLQSKNRHEAVAIVTLNSTTKQAPQDYAALRGLINSSTLSVVATGTPATRHD